MARNSILLVDDEIGIRKSLGAILKEEGFKVEAVASGEDCLALLENKSFELILLDVWLPGIDGLQTLARDRGVEIKVAPPPDTLMVLGDRDELIRALENLVENALKYGAAGKRLDIALARGQTRSGAPEARVAVRDYGPGISPEHLPRLTERFYRVDVADSRAQGGTGGGRAQVKNNIKPPGGRRNIESTLGQGATFTMHLPLPTGGSTGSDEI